MLTTTESALL